MAGSQVVGKRIRLTSGILLRFDRPTTLAQVRASLTVRPLVKGTVKALSNRVYRFTPAAPLAANTSYTVTFSKKIKDSDGVCP